MRRFSLADPRDLPSLVAGLADRGGLEREPARTFSRTLYDTFDWRLFGRQLVVEHQRDGSLGTLVWRSTDTGEQLARLDVDEMPRFVWDLPPGPIAERLGDVVEMRALLPLVTVETTRTMLRLVDGEHKTIARVVVDADRIAGRRLLAPVIEVFDVRGYEGSADAVAELIGAQVNVREAHDDGLVAALEAAGYAPGSYTSKLRLSLDPDAPAIDSWVVVLRALLATLVANEAGLRDDIDSEFLHDFRVAVRRTRSVLGQGRDILPPAVRDRFREEFAWLGQATSPTRDFDVFLLTLPEFAKSLPVERRDDLKPFRAFLEHRQRAAHASLVADLDTERYASLLHDWQSFLDAPTATIDEPDSTRGTAAVVSERIARAHRRLIRDGRSIDEHSHPEDLHELRKDAKKLRYLLECFGSALPAEGVGPVVKELKVLQDVLGEYQDCQVQVGSLERFGQEMLDEEQVPAAALMALGFVVEQLVEREQRARDDFDSRFDRFDSKAVRRAVRSLPPSSGAGGDGA